MDYTPTPAYGQPVDSDPCFSLRVGDDGTGFVHCGDGVVVVPLDAHGQVLLALEFAPGRGREVLVLPGGSAEVGESLEETANRELQEELGWRAARMDYLGELHPFKYLTCRQFVFLARELSAHRLGGDEVHPIRMHAVPLDKAMDLCLAGELHDALAVAALAITRRFLQPADGEGQG